MFILFTESAPGRRQVRCAQAFGSCRILCCANFVMKLLLAGSEIFVGCINGDLLRFVLQADKLGKVKNFGHSSSVGGLILCSLIPTSRSPVKEFRVTCQ